MKLTIGRKTLHEALQTAGRAVSATTSLPILRNLLLEADGETLRVTATDLELGITLAVPATATEPGSVTLPAKTLSEMVASLPEADVTLTLDPDHPERVTVACRRSEYRLSALSAEEYPSLPEVEGHSFVVPQGALREALRRTVFAVSDDDTRPILTGVLMEGRTTELRLVATDTHRLAVAKLLDQEVTASFSAIVPGRAMTELLRALADTEEPVRLECSPNQLAARTERLTLVTRLIEGQYPKYERVIPAACVREWTMGRESLMGALRRAGIVARDCAAAHRVRLQFEGDLLTVSAEAGDLGHAREEVECEPVGAAEPFSFAISGRYVLEMLGALDCERLRLRANDPLAPVVLVPEGGAGYVGVTMPMQEQ